MSYSPSETVPDAREVLHHQMAAFSMLVERRQAIKAIIQDAESKVKDLDRSITEIMTEAGVPKLKHGNSTVSIVAGKRYHLDKDQLVEKGVSASLIRECTVTVTYNYILVKEG